MVRLEITVHILCLKYAYLEWPAGAHHDEQGRRSTRVFPVSVYNIIFELIGVSNYN